MQRALDVYFALKMGLMNTRSTALDTRPAHATFFDGLTPTGHKYFAGHYRGEGYPCLKNYGVEVPGDSRVGCHPAHVKGLVQGVSNDISACLDFLDSDETLKDVERVEAVVQLAARIFVAFLAIHPYANGNGHAGRLIVHCIMGRYGLWLERWTLEPRPPEPAYTRSIIAYRDGNPLDLERQLTSMMSPL